MQFIQKKLVDLNTQREKTSIHSISAVLLEYNERKSSFFIQTSPNRQDIMSANSLFPLKPAFPQRIRACKTCKTMTGCDIITDNYCSPGAFQNKARKAAQGTAGNTAVSSADNTPDNAARNTPHNGDSKGNKTANTRRKAKSSAGRDAGL